MRSYCLRRILFILLGISLDSQCCVQFFRQRRWAVVIIFFTAGCQVATSAKASSIIQSNSRLGMACIASVNAGKAWIKSPIEVNLTSNTLMDYPGISMDLSFFILAEKKWLDLCRFAALSVIK